MKILGIESSCDETAASVVENGTTLHSNIIHSQIDIHAEYGGVVPEIAARSHLEVIGPVVSKAVSQANLDWSDIDAIAVTYAPGLIGSLLAGTLTARGLAILHDKPLYPVHHVEAHVYANFITRQSSTTSLTLPSSEPQFPLLALIVSGNHTQLALFKGHGDYSLLGQTQDDAVGEAFDKVAKILGLPYPGGPSISSAAATGDPTRYTLPKAQLRNPYDFSFSGPKTAVLRAIQRETGVDYTFPSHQLSARLTGNQLNDFAASFQYSAIKTLVDATEKAFYEYSPTSVVIAGGVAANTELRRQLSNRLPLAIQYAPMELCTDNGAMVASLGYFQSKKLPPADPYTLSTVPRISMNDTAWT